MSVIVPKDGVKALQDIGLADATNYQIRCRLFKNDFTPDRDTVNGDLTECDFPGYAPSSPAYFGLAAPDISGREVNQFPSTTFTRSTTGTAQVAYGYYLTFESSAKLLAVERFSSPLSFTLAGDAFSIVPRISGYSLFP